MPREQYLYFLSMFSVLFEETFHKKVQRKACYVSASKQGPCISFLLQSSGARLSPEPLCLSTRTILGSRNCV
uniref:Uncharacterized protein n=1 Tax=Anguilla anguilla TaxID=7936 RepID=A0A0E9Q248_ANGAN